MDVKYLHCSNDIIFDVFARKTDTGIKYQFMSIDPLARLITKPEDIQFLINSISNFSDIINSIKIKESLNSDILFDQDYFIFGTRQVDDKPIEFAYSEEFLFNKEDMDIICEKSKELSGIILSVIAGNEDEVKRRLEEELTDIISYNYSPIQEDSMEILGVLLAPNENGEICLTARYYSENDHADNPDKISNMLNSVYNVVADELIRYRFFLIQEETPIMKLGITTSGDYVFNTNPFLLSDLNDEKQITVQNILINTYESL